MSFALAYLIPRALLRAVADRRAWEATIAEWAAREASPAERQRGHAAAHRARCIARGLCAVCLVTPAPTGYRTCAGCRDRVRRWEAARIAAGLCVRCGVRPLASRVRCAGCLAADARRTAARAARRAA